MCEYIPINSYLSIHTDEDYAMPIDDTNFFTVTFGVGSGDGTVETAMISAVEDTAVEGDHEFTMSIQSTIPLTMFGVSSVRAIIMDDDCKFCEVRISQWHHSYMHACIIVTITGVITVSFLTVVVSNVTYLPFTFSCE